MLTGPTITGGKKQASVPLSRIKDLRFGSQGALYRTALSISKDVQPRWLTIIYSLPPSSRVLNNAANYKLVHFIAPSVQVVQLWKNALDGFREGRMAKAIPAQNEDNAEQTRASDEHKVVTEQDVHQLCARLGVGMGKTEISAAFKVGMAVLCQRTLRLKRTPRSKRRSPTTLWTLRHSRSLSSYSSAEMSWRKYSGRTSDLPGNLLSRLGPSLWRKRKRCGGYG